MSLVVSVSISVSVPSYKMIKTKNPTWEYLPDRTLRLVISENKKTLHRSMISLVVIVLTFWVQTPIYNGDFRSIRALELF